MKILLNKWFSKPWYSIAISAYPVLALLSANAGQVQLTAGIRPLILSILFGFIVFFVVWLFIRQLHKAAFLTTLLLALFFSYGHVYIYIDESYPDSNYTFWLAIGWIVLFVLAIFWATRPRLRSEEHTSELQSLTNLVCRLLLEKKKK